MVYGLTLHRRNIMCSYFKFELRIVIGFSLIKGRANYLQSKSSALLVSCQQKKETELHSDAGHTEEKERESSVQECKSSKHF